MKPVALRPMRIKGVDDVVGIGGVSGRADVIIGFCVVVIVIVAVSRFSFVLFVVCFDMDHPVRPKFLVQLHSDLLNSFNFLSACW